jgi:hypothetical protein
MLMTNADQSLRRLFAVLWALLTVAILVPATTWGYDGHFTLAADTVITNPVPTTLARVIPNGINTTTLGAPGMADVFVTDAAQLEGLNAQQIAAKLAIPESPTENEWGK